MILQVLKRTAAFTIAASLIFTALPSAWQSEQCVRAAETRQSMVMGISAIQAPYGIGTSWNGDYIYYGNYQGTDLKWRVLDVTGNAGNSSITGGILLQANQALSDQRPFEDGSDQANEHQQGAVSDNQWIASDIRTWLQGEAYSQFLNDNNFSAKEKAGILRTTKEAGISPLDNLKSTGLDQDTMFLLDISDLSNANYGYQITDGFTDSSIGNFWWLRSTHANAKYDNVIASVLSGGYVYYNFTGENGAVVPAFNLDASKILFVSDANTAKNNSLQPVTSTSSHEWKLTLLDTKKSVSVTSAPTRNGNVIHVPYSYSGDNGAQLSLMITGSDGTIRYYGKAADITSETGSIDFTLPDGFNEYSDTVSILAEQVNAASRTDYASPLAKVEIPPLHIHVYPDTWQYNETEHWQDCIAPDCDGSGYQSGKHDLEEDDELSEPATCIADGILWYTCPCGYGYSEPDLRSDHIDEDDGTMDVDLHDFGDNEPELIQKPTYTTEGSERTLCTLCGQWITEIIDPLSEEHDFEEEIIKEVTCTEDGLKRLTCSEEYCEEVRTETIPAPGHSFGEWEQTLAPTTDTEGVSTRTCSVCGATETQSIPMLVPEHTHNYHKNVWKINQYIHWHECDCGKTKDMEEHLWNKGKILKKATKTSMGKVQYTCTVCKYKVEYMTPSVGTTFSSGKYKFKVLKGKNNQLVVTSLGFAKGKSAKTVKIPKTVYWNGVKYTTKAIANNAFRDNNKIKKIIINDKIKTIGNLAFFNTKNVKTIIIGKNVQGIGSHAFCHIGQLKKIKVKSKKLKLSTEYGILHNTKASTIIVPKRKIKIYKKTIFAAQADKVSSK